MSPHDHKLFTALYRRLVKLEDKGEVGSIRSQISAGLSGRIAIVGLGPGIDLLHLPASVSEVVAVEPSASMRQAAGENIAKARARGITVQLFDAVGEALPMADNSVDGVLLAYVMCTVTDPDQTLREVNRILRPGGQLAVVEHVAAPAGSAMARWQRLAGPVWPKLAAGCHCDRDTAGALQRAGFNLDFLTARQLVPIPPVAPALYGVTTRQSEQPSDH